MKIKKINEDLIIAIIFLTTIFFIFIITLVENYAQLKENSLKIIKEDGKTKSSKIADIIISDEKIFNENLAMKEQFIDLYGLLQKGFGKKYIQDSTDRTRDIIKTRDDMLTFIQKQEDMEIRAQNIIKLNEELKKEKIKLIYVQAPYKIRNENELPIGIVDYANENADMLLSELENGDVKNIDLREIFQEMKIEDEYFVTDHHWKIRTAFSASNYISDILNKEYNFNIDQYYYNIDNYKCINMKKSFLGSIGKRIGKYYSGIEDFEYILPNFDTDLQVEKGDEKLQGTFGETIIEKKLIEDEDVKTNRYACYFGGDYSEIRIKNNSNNLNNKILVIQDSYGLALSSLMALRVGELRTIDLRHFEKSEIEYIKEYNPDIVIMMYNPSAFYIEKIFQFE